MKKFKRAFSFSEASRGRHFDITETIDEHTEHFTTEDAQNGHKNRGNCKRFSSKHLFAVSVKFVGKLKKKLSRLHGMHSAHELKLCVAWKAFVNTQHTANACPFATRLFTITAVLVPGFAAIRKSLYKDIQSEDYSLQYYHVSFICTGY